MDILVQILGKLFSFAYQLAFGNYLLSIIVFTLLTKIILLPVSIWTQKNGIKMIKMQPQINMIKVKFFGDKDAIADEMQALYKHEKYNAFAGTIPLIIQIIILIGIINVVKMPEAADLSYEQMVLGDICFYDYPYHLGGLYWTMPIWAGFSALILSLVQNRLNPLQSEQSKAGQYGTMAVSVGISLFLGAYVQVAVGTYWIVSNLMTILQQLVLNLIINPKKYIDYEKLEESREKLNELQNVGKIEDKTKRREYARKEKEDYKRFFSVVNKHLVFYSENNGFYKYFKNTIEYLLEHSNLTIHYVTGDPNDKIFEMAEKNNRIRGYYIGEKRLITLMMKMDADMVVMTMSDLENYHIKRSYIRKDIEYVYMFHYPLSTHMVLHTGALDHYDTILCVGDFQMPEIRKQEELNHLPEKKLVVCGYGQLELLQKQYEQMPPKKTMNPKILIAPSWQTDNILDSCIDALLKELLGKGWDIFIRPHPEYMKRYKARMDAIVDRYKTYQGEDLHFELDFTDNSSLFNSDVVISDWSGAAYEFAFVTGKPVVFINTPMKVNNPEYVKLGIEPLEISLRSKVGISLNPDEIDGCYQQITELVAKQDAYIENNIRLREQYIANFGHSGETSGEYIIQSLKEKIKDRKMGENR